MSDLHPNWNAWRKLPPRHRQLHAIRPSRRGAFKIAGGTGVNWRGREHYTYSRQKFAFRNRQNAARVAGNPKSAHYGRKLDAWRQSRLGKTNKGFGFPDQEFKSHVRKQPRPLARTGKPITKFSPSSLVRAATSTRGRRIAGAVVIAGAVAGGAYLAHRQIQKRRAAQGSHMSRSQAARVAANARWHGKGRRK